MIRQGRMTWLESAANASSASTGIAVTSGTTEVYGSWVELIASTEGVADHVLLQVFYPRSAFVVRSFRLDIGIGGAGSETVIVSALQFQLKEDGNNVMYYSLPLRIPSGVRVSVRIAASAGTLTLHVALALFASGQMSFPGHNRLINYGTGVNPSGVAIDPGGSANTKGSWTEIIATTAYEFPRIILCISGNDNQAQTDCTWLLDLAVGAAASETAIVSNLFISASNLETVKSPIEIPLLIPKGVRVSARAQCSITDATDRVLTLSIAGYI